MADELYQSDGIGGRHATARQTAERAIKAQAAGDDEEAGRLFDEAARIDPDAVSAVLAERAGDPRDGATGMDAEAQDDAEIAGMSRTVEPGLDAPSRSGVTGAGSGADGQGT